ncbi:MAG: LamG-like jellyroll fold domain-containing protein, partial [Planctomycetota bacterium]|nr:LamG-like jellyroll fold domain-containing protein [Planctomycetota bacterium]
MSFSTRWFFSSFAIVLLFAHHAELKAQAIAQWDFEGSLDATTQSQPLVGEFATPAFETVFDFEEKEFGEDVAEVCRFEQGTYFRMYHGLSPNAGGAYVNQYTLIIDVMYPEAFGPDDPDGLLGTTGWQALYQTNETNTNDGDWFVNPTGGIGISGNYPGSVPDGQWHRLALAVDLVAGTYTSYINGERVQQNTGQTVDGRFSLGESVLIFADESGETAGGYVSSIQIRDVAMTDAELAEMGGPTAEGIPLPECLGPRCCLNRQFRVNYIADSNTVVASWASLEGDEAFELLRNGEPVSEILSADTVSFEDRDPPAGGAGVEYVLRHLQGGEEEVSCSSPVDTFACPDRLDCRVDQVTSTVTLGWSAGINLPVTGFSLRRDGVEIAALEATETSYTDVVAEAGRYNYTVAILGEDGEICDTALACLAVVTGIDLGPGIEGVINQYDFNGDLSSSTGGQDLLPFISPPLDPAFDEPGYDFEDAVIGEEEAEVATFTRGTFFQLFTGFEPNGGGGYTNQYTLIMDVMFPEGSLLESGWAALYNTNPPAGNDGDWFVQNANRGIGIGGNYAGEVLPDTWHRLALVVDLVEGTYTSYIDGNQVQQNTGETLDGRFSLYSINDGALEGFSIFADDTGDNSSGYVNSVQVRDVAMPAGQIAALGGPSAEGIPVLPPYTCPMGLQCCADQQSRDVTLSWEGGAGMAGLEIFRNGESIASIAVDESTFTDQEVPPGNHVYEIRATGEEECGNLPLSCNALLFAEEDYILFEGFDCYRTDEELAAAGWEAVEANAPLEDQRWTITNPSGRANPPGANGKPTTGGFVISEYASASLDVPGSGASHDFWSPSFSTVGHDEVWLHMDASVQLNNNGDAIFDVDVSTDDGATWDNVYRRIAPARMVEPLPSLDLDNVDGAYGRMHIDLSEFAADQDSVRFRLRHFEPTWDWWIAVDNVLVDSIAPGGNIEVLPLVDFSDEAV